jgi:lipoyl(octanoyl) transferase
MKIRDLGLIEYEQAYAIQRQSVADVMQGDEPHLLLCEHPAVLTIGRMDKYDNFLVPRSEIMRHGISIVDCDRGGEVTLHAPGQLVIYPIWDLKRFYHKDLRFYLLQLEEVAIDFLKSFGILSCRFPGHTGVWIPPFPSLSIPDTKIVSVGIGVKKWVTYHGMAININTDLNLFSYIRPCGLDVKMASVCQILGRNVDMAQSKQQLIRVFKERFVDSAYGLRP